MIGYWYTDESKLNILQIYLDTDNKLVGELILLNDRGHIQNDLNNPNKTAQKQSILGLKLFEGFTQKTESHWANGQIYNPQDGKKYQAFIKLKDNNTVSLSGYVLLPIFSKSIQFIRCPDSEAKKTLELVLEIHQKQFDVLKKYEFSSTNAIQKKYLILDSLKDTFEFKIAHYQEKIAQFK